jgi:chorismate-pyruvate lyase
MLLGTDGTVTRLLEAYVGEPIVVTKILQAFDTADDGDEDLDLPSGTRVLRRRVLLRGGRSGQTWLYAEAVVAPARLPGTLLERLLCTDEPIGVLLAEDRTETFREILRVNREPAGSCGAYFGCGGDAEIFARTYRIVTAGQPMILITEKFPVSSFPDSRLPPAGA